jgi:carnitine-CoA ligase
VPSIPTLSAIDSLEHHASGDPAHPFVVDLTEPGGPRTWSYGDAMEDVERLAAGLRTLGVGPGDRVALRMANSWAFVAVLLASLRIGAIAVPTIRQYSPDELRYTLEDSGAVCLVFDDGPGAGAVLDALPDGLTAISTEASAPGARPTSLDRVRSAGNRARRSTRQQATALRADDDAMIFYTSGTTSRPKGVVLTHGAILESCRISADDQRLRSDDRGLVVLPLFHCNALFIQLVPLLLAGATAVIADRFSASGYLDTMRDHRITLANLTAGAARSVLAQPERPEDRDHRVRRLTFGLPLHADEIARIEARFGMPAHMVYGLTESTCGGTRTPLHIAPRSGWQSLGIAQPGWRVAISREDGEPAAFGEIGEILLQGPGVMDRYWNRPDATAEAKRGGWLHTGDLGVQDEAGFLYFHSRIKDMLKPKGENVAASEIEEVLEQHPGVVEAAVIGVFDPHHEERIVAFVSGAREEDDADVLRAHCEGRLAAFKVPSEFHRLDVLPHTSIGKVNKGELRRLAAAL